jgi:hypothetical protein
MIDLPQIAEQVQGQAIVLGVSLLKRGHIKLETAFKYPDGTSVEVFVRKPDLANEINLTDLGQTHAWLLDAQIRPWLSKKRQAFLDDALKTCGVTQAGGELQLSIGSLAEVTEGTIRLAQACVRVADLAYTRRSSLQTEFVEEVGEVVEDLELPYESNVEVPGKYEKLVRVDLRVAAKFPSLVLVWSSGNSSQAHVTQNEIFRKWSDLDRRAEQRVTIFDDRFDVYRDEDMKRLRDVSQLVAISDRPMLEAVLAAA